MSLYERHLQCIAHIVYGEARNESIEGQFLVAWSILYRAAANLPDFGGSDYCAVAYKVSHTEFGKKVWQYDGAKALVRDMAAWDMAVYVAQYALAGYGRPDQPVMYFCSVYVRGACRWHNGHVEYVGQIGGHRFYIDRRFPQFMVASTAE
jgi:spore germination cell wall hydrolase CwlJ-like protein